MMAMIIKIINSIIDKNRKIAQLLSPAMTLPKVFMNLATIEQFDQKLLKHFSMVVWIKILCH